MNREKRERERGVRERVPPPTTITTTADDPLPPNTQGTATPHGMRSSARGRGKCRTGSPPWLIYGLILSANCSGGGRGERGSGWRVKGDMGVVVRGY